MSDFPEKKRYEDVIIKCSMLLALQGGGWGSNFQENSVTYHLNSPIEHDDTFYNHKFQFYYKVIMMCICIMNKN